MHGGAGLIRARGGEVAETYRRGLADAARAGRDALARGESALAAVVAAVKLMEASGAFNAGRGACLDEAGRATLDAALMRGADRAAGAVGALTATLHPTDVCLDLLQEGRHVLLVGEGADARARRLQLPPLPPPTPELVATWNKLRAAEAGQGKPEDLGSVGRPDDEGRGDQGRGAREGKSDTVGAVAVDAQGRVAAAVTTGGLWLKARGRVGDSGVPGAGLFACDELGAAASCTGIGERMMRALMAKLACDRVGAGASAAEAARTAVDDVTRRFGKDSGGLIVVDRQGRVGAAFDTQGMGRALARPGEDAVSVAVWPEDPFPA